VNCSGAGGIFMIQAIRMFAIPIEGATNVFCDNKAVTKNAIHPELTLKKKRLKKCDPSRIDFEEET
jgi:hypothetical protein